MTVERDGTHGRAPTWRQGHREARVQAWLSQCARRRCDQAAESATGGEQAGMRSILRLGVLMAVAMPAIGKSVAA